MVTCSVPCRDAPRWELQQDDRQAIALGKASRKRQVSSASFCVYRKHSTEVGALRSLGTVPEACVNA